MDFKFNTREVAQLWYKTFGYIAETRWIHEYGVFKIDVFYRCSRGPRQDFSMRLSARGPSEAAAWQQAILNICSVTGKSFSELAEQGELMAISNDLTENTIAH